MNAGSSRPRRQRRGEERRLALLDAALRLIARGGTLAATHRAAAAEAGVPLASTTYDFASRDDLLEQALAHAVTTDLRLMAPAHAALREAASTDEAARIVARAFAARLDGDREGVVAAYEIALEAARRPRLRDAARAWAEAYASAFEPALTRLGSPAPAIDAELAARALDGLILDELAAPRAGAEQRLYTALRRLLAAACRGE